MIKERSLLLSRIPMTTPIEFRLKGTYSTICELDEMSCPRLTHKRGQPKGFRNRFG